MSGRAINRTHCQDWRKPDEKMGNFTDKDESQLSSWLGYIPSKPNKRQAAKKRRNRGKSLCNEGWEPGYER